MTTGEPTYWHKGLNKVQYLLHFEVTTSISNAFMNSAPQSQTYTLIRPQTIDEATTFISHNKDDNNKGV